MFKTHEVRDLVEQGLGLALAKVDEDTPDYVYCVDTETKSAGELQADFTTYHDGEESHDIYRITVELIK